VIRLPQRPSATPNHPTSVQRMQSSTSAQLVQSSTAPNQPTAVAILRYTQPPHTSSCNPPTAQPQLQSSRCSQPALTNYSQPTPPSSAHGILPLLPTNPHQLMKSSHCSTSLSALKELELVFAHPIPSPPLPSLLPSPHLTLEWFGASLFKTQIATPTSSQRSASRGGFLCKVQTKQQSDRSFTVQQQPSESD
jgi:hypothetical protein